MKKRIGSANTKIERAAPKPKMAKTPIESLYKRNDSRREEVILAENTGQNIRKIEKDTERDFFMSAEEAMKYGLIDKVLKKRDK